MDLINFSNLKTFINYREISFKENVIMKKNIPIEYLLEKCDKYTVENILALENIVNVEKGALKYPMGEGIKMLMLNMILHTKNELQEKLDAKITIEIYEIYGRFDIYIVIVESQGFSSKIRVSMDRSFELYGNPSKPAFEILEKLKNRFIKLALLPI